jgi:hypothetical protein
MASAEGSNVLDWNELTKGGKYVLSAKYPFEKPEFIAEFATMDEALRATDELRKRRPRAWRFSRIDFEFAPEKYVLLPESVKRSITCNREMSAYSGVPQDLLDAPRPCVFSKKSDRKS